MNGSRDTPADAATMPGASGRPAKTAMIIAQRIVADIARDSLAPGAALPPERMMLEPMRSVAARCEKPSAFSSSRGS